MVLDDGLVASAGIASNILASLFLTKDELNPLVEENQSKTTNPIQKYLEVATGILGFSPKTFLGMTQNKIYVCL